MCYVFMYVYIYGKIKGRWKWQEDVRSYWMTLRTGEDTLI